LPKKPDGLLLGLLPLAAQKRLRRRWLRGKSRVPAKEMLFNLQ